MVYNGTEYPDRVTRGADNVYRWSGHFDLRERKRTLRIPLWVVGGLCLFFLVAGALMDPDILGVLLLTCGSVMAITGGVCFLFWRSSGDVSQPYELTGEHIRYVAEPKVDTVIPFRRIRTVSFSEPRKMIRIRSALTGFPVFVPAEDYPFVQNYIRQRLPDNARIEYL